MDTLAKLRELKRIIGGIGPAVVAFSGGADSTFLLKVAGDVLGDKVTAVTVLTPFLSIDEKKNAFKIAKKLKAEYVSYGIELSGDVTANGEDRCYLCKKAVFSSIKDMAAELGREAVMEGSNVDDGKDHRPGKKALKELGIESPLAAAGFTKREIRLLSRAMGLDTWDKPSCSCLAARIPYGEKITPEKLMMIDKAEGFLRAAGFRTVRVRMHGDIARVEVEPEMIRRLLDRRDVMIKKLRTLGIKYICADLEGYRSGSMNEVIKWKRKK